MPPFPIGFLLLRPRRSFVFLGDGHHRSSHLSSSTAVTSTVPHTRFGLGRACNSTGQPHLVGEGKISRRCERLCARDAHLEQVMQDVGEPIPGCHHLSAAAALAPFRASRLLFFPVQSPPSRRAVTYTRKPTETKTTFNHHVRKKLQGRRVCDLCMFHVVQAWSSIGTYVDASGVPNSEQSTRCSWVMCTVLYEIEGLWRSKTVCWGSANKLRMFQRIWRVWRFCTTAIYLLVEVVTFVKGNAPRAPPRCVRNASPVLRLAATSTQDAPPKKNNTHGLVLR